MLSGSTAAWTYTMKSKEKERYLFHFFKQTFFLLVTTGGINNDNLHSFLSTNNSRRNSKYLN